MFTKAAFLIAASLTVTPIAPAEKPPEETVTITKELAEKLVQARVAQQMEIERLKHEIYLYQMALGEARSKMCA